MSVAQLSKYTKNHWTAHFKLVTFRYINYISNKKFKNDDNVYFPELLQELTEIAYMRHSLYAHLLIR